MQVEIVIGSLQLKLSVPDNRKNGTAIVANVSKGKCVESKQMTKASYLLQVN